MFSWEPGRQGTGYKKLRLWQGNKSDCYLIYYPKNASIPTHVDIVPTKKHFRINFLLWGEDRFKGETIFSLPRIKFFRPDIAPHSVEKISKQRLILSIGWIQ